MLRYKHDDIPSHKTEMGVDQVLILPNMRSHIALRLQRPAVGSEIGDDTLLCAELKVPGKDML